MIDRYMTSTKNLPAIMQKIVEGAAPPRFGSAHLRALGFKSSNDQGAVGLLKALGFLTEDGAPTERYHAYRDKGRSGAVLGAALREAYPEVFHVNEHPTIADRRAIIGVAMSTLNAEERRASMIVATFLALLQMADLDGAFVSSPASGAGSVDQQTVRHSGGIPVPSGFIVHTFQLRRDSQIQVALPSDLSNADVARLHRWLQTLPLEEEVQN